MFWNILYILKYTESYLHGNVRYICTIRIRSGKILSTLTTGWIHILKNWNLNNYLVVFHTLRHKRFLIWHTVKLCFHINRLTTVHWSYIRNLKYLWFDNFFFQLDVVSSYYTKQWLSFLVYFQTSQHAYVNPPI